MEVIPPRPKRSLSAYNLFYRYKRGKIVKAQSNTANGNTKEAICNLVLCPPGLEDYSPPNGCTTLPSLEDETIKSIRRTDIRSALHNNLHSTDTSKRSHRKKGNGSSMTFVEMNDIMCKAWKVCDACGRSIFEELALEGRMQNVERIAEYERKYPHAASSPKKNKMKYKRRKSLPASTLTSTTIVNDPTQKMMKSRGGNSQPLIMKLPQAPFSTPSTRNVMDFKSGTGIAPPPLNHIKADDDYTFDQQVNNMGDYNTVGNNQMSSHQNFPTFHPSMSMPSISVSDYLLPQFTDGSMASSFANFQSPTSVIAPSFMLGQSVSSEDVAGAFQANNSMMMQPPTTNPFDDPNYYDAFGNARPNTNFNTSMLGMMSQQAQALGSMMSQQQAPALGPTPQADPQESEGEESLWDSLPALPTTSSLEEEKNEVSEDDFLKLINTMDGNLP